MKASSALAVVVFFVCFFIGYLAYLATVLIADGILSVARPCQDAALCASPNAEPAAK